MTRGDRLQRFIFENAAIRGEIVNLDATWRTVLEQREYPPAVRILLGELMASAALLAATLKFSGTLTMQLQGSGPIGLLVVECTSENTLRATAHWSGELPASTTSLTTLVGSGNLVVTIDPQNSRERYQGIVNLEGATIAAALENYLTQSEQLDTRLWLTADGERAAGMLLQKLPSKTETDEDAWPRAVHLGSTITTQELLQLQPFDIIRRLYHEEDVRVFESEPVSFRCSCSRDRVIGMLRMLGYDEIKSLLEERGQVEVHCEFCNQRYAFDRVDAEQIFAAGVVSDAPRGYH
jgi:molecular chaperone Hsp33